MKIITKNKKATFNYQLLKKYLSGISLQGWEVKSIRNGNLDLSNAFILEDKYGNLKLRNLKISKYEYNTQSNQLEERNRQLLLNKIEIKRILHERDTQKLLMIPTMLFFDKKGLIKVEFYLAKPRKKHDKREYKKEQEFNKLRKKYIDR